MCILPVLARGVGDRGLWVAANREERFDRPWQPPRSLLSDSPMLGGRDLVIGGTWLAVILCARSVAAVTNGRLTALPRERSTPEAGLAPRRYAGKPQVTGRSGMAPL